MVPEKVAMVSHTPTPPKLDELTSGRVFGTRILTLDCITAGKNIWSFSTHVKARVLPSTGAVVIEYILEGFMW